MKKVFIKYNPYKLETEITIDGDQLASNSKLAENIAEGKRLQEWIEFLPENLIDEFNDIDFDIQFHGTIPDYEDVTAVFTEAKEKGILKFKLNRISAKETSDKEVLIEKVFEDILNGPFDELRDKEIRNAFAHAKSSEFEVCVVATMSAGKSTLINAMLGTKLMPSKQEACTAIITRIKDCTQESVPFQAEVYTSDNTLIEVHKELNYTTMERLNANKDIFLIKADGNIPFVSSEDVSLVLIDTPGPNNSRDRNHETVQRELLGRSSKALVLYIMTGEFGTDDDNSLLKRVAESMSVGGKQSKDRFIFVVNKLDDRKKEDGDTKYSLERVRNYLKTHGIANPNLFPASALTALNIRMIENGMDVDEDTKDETEIKIKKLNRNNELHFETYADLPPSIYGEINEQLEKAKSGWDYENRKNDNPNEALIHTGIVSIEAAIRQYVHKYAKTAKIKNIVDTFIHKLDAVGCFEKTKHELAKNQEDSKQIVAQIKSIRNKMDSAKDAKKYKDAVDDAIIKINDASKIIIEEIIEKFQSIITKRIDDFRNIELNLDEADYEVGRLIRFAKQLEPDFEVELDELIQNNLINTSIVLLDNYKAKLTSLSNDVDIASINIEPLKLMGGVVNIDNFSSKKFVEVKEVENGKEWIENTSKAWYKPWTWMQSSGYYRTKYKKIEFISGAILAQEFFKPVQDSLYGNGEEAMNHAVAESKKISKRFEIEFKTLDDILKKKLAELEQYATDKQKADDRVKESEIKLQWLEKINKKVESILEI